MRKRILVVLMTALCLLLCLEIFMEGLFSDRLQEMVPTLMETESTDGARSFPSAQPTEARPKENTAEILAIFGVDQKEGDEGRSDCILLAAVSEEGTLRLCSLARDTLVNLPDSGEEAKLCHAYAYGGAKLAMKTINENFGLHITKYVSVNFTEMQTLIDQVGGVPLQLSREEWHYLGLSSPYLGRTRLDGEKALTYSRIRELDSDEGRTLRQRKLLSALVTELRNQPMTQLLGEVRTGLHMCRTNLGAGEIFSLARRVMQGTLETQGIAIPGREIAAWSGIRKDGGWYYVYNLREAGTIMEDYLNGAEKTEKSACIQTASMLK